MKQTVLLKETLYLGLFSISPLVHSTEHFVLPNQTRDSASLHILSAYHEKGSNFAVTASS